MILPEDLRENYRSISTQELSNRLAGFYNRVFQMVMSNCKEVGFYTHWYDRESYVDVKPYHLGHYEPRYMVNFEPLSDDNDSIDAIIFDIQLKRDPNRWVLISDIKLATKQFKRVSYINEFYSNLAHKATELIETTHRMSVNGFGTHRMKAFLDAYPLSLNSKKYVLKLLRKTERQGTIKNYIRAWRILDLFISVEITVGRQAYIHYKQGLKLILKRYHVPTTKTI